MGKNFKDGILSVMVVAILLISSIMVIQTTMATSYDEMDTYSLVPGVDIYAGCNWTVNSTSSGGNVSVLNTSTTNLKYGETLNILVNGSLNWDSSATYNLYYPVYTGAHDETYSMEWKKYTGVAGTGTLAPQIDPSSSDYTFGNSVERDVHLNRSGLWIIDHNANHSADSKSWMNQTIPAWFWVNTTQNLTSSASDSTFNYDDDGKIKITTSEVAMVAVYYKDSGSSQNKLIERYSAQSVAHGDENYIEYNKNSSVFQWAGNYSVHVYEDLDGGSNELGTLIYYYEPSVYYKYFNLSYGDSSLSTFDSTIESTTNYSYDWCGPWDPPEVNASKKTILVEPATEAPNINIALTNTTQNWGFSGKIDINVTDSDGNGIDGLNVTIQHDDDNYSSVYYADDTGSGSYGAGNTSITSNWAIGENGTWYVRVRKVNTGGTLGNTYQEQYNATAKFTLEKAPGLQIKIQNDGGGSKVSDMQVEGGPPTAGFINITFRVVNSTHTYYGASDAASARKNITLSGDACLLAGGEKTLQELYELNSASVSFWDSKNWSVNLIPSMDTAANGGGEITIGAEWEDHGGKAEDKTIQIGGSDYNGSLVSISPSSIPIDKNTTLTVTVTSPNNPDYGYAGATVTLYFVGNDGKPATTHTINQSTSGSFSGEFTFHFNSTQQTTNQTNIWSDYAADRYIVAKADIGASNYGYSCAKLEYNHDFKSTFEAVPTPITGSSNTIIAGRNYDEFWFNVSMVDSTGNTTGYPTTGTGQDELQFAIYNETGGNVTDSIGAEFSWSDLTVTSTSDDALNLSISNTYITEPGTYTLYVYNKTHDSTGYNSTIYVESVDIASELGAYIYMVDKNVSDTFTVTYGNQLLNGTLQLINITEDGDYNKTWVNYSDDTSGNASIIDLEVENGVVHLNNITANYLQGSKAMQNITMKFKCDESGSQYAYVGLIPVKIATVTPSTNALVYAQPAELTIAVTGRGQPLNDVFVSINVPGLSGEMNTTTTGNGEATFAFTPPSTGEITIAVENRTSDTKVQVTAWKLYLDVGTNSEVDENTQFTVTVRNGSATGAEITGATVTFAGETVTSGYTFTSPSVKVTKDFTMTAIKDGYASDSDVVTVVNVPKLMIIPSSTEVDASGDVEITIADDQGNAIVGATVSFNDKTYTTGAQGTVKITAPTEKGQYTITATKDGFQDADSITITIKEGGGVPGFELFTLIAALGVAFILLRRRRQ